MSTQTPLDSDRRIQPRAGQAGAAAPVREIVVGVDGTESALGAVRWAAQEGAQRAAPLRIVHAATYLGGRPTTGVASPELAAARRITAQAYTVARHTDSGVQAATEVVAGDPVAVLLDAAGSGQLVVLGSSTTGAADEWVHATVAARVAARSPGPVVVIPRRRGTGSAARPVAAVLGDDPEDDEAVLAFAARAAERTGTGLAVVRTGPETTGEPPEWESRFPGLEVHRIDLPGASGNQLIAATCPSPLIVLSAGHGSLLHRTLDGPHRWLLRHCTFPMALVPPADRARSAAAHEEDSEVG